MTRPIHLLVALLGVATLASALAAITSVIFAVGSLIYSEGEAFDASICREPESIIYTYLRILMISGSVPARVWKTMKVDQDLAAARHMLAVAEKYPDVHQKLLEAMNNNFHLDEKISLEVENDLRDAVSLKIKLCDKNIRRSVFSERFKDMLQHMGMATLFGLGTFIFIFVLVRFAKKIDDRV